MNKIFLKNNLKKINLNMNDRSSKMTMIRISSTYKDFECYERRKQIAH